jgi:hypothetical protein
MIGRPVGGAGRCRLNQEKPVAFFATDFFLFAIAQRAINRQMQLNDSDTIASQI